VIQSKSKIPQMMIKTDNNSVINSKEIYVNGFIEIVELYDDIENVISSGSMGIKGRGNSTWDMPKKPYKIKFDEKKSFFQLPENKHWVLLANYADKSMLRNEVAFEMGRISVLEWTPGTQFLDVFLNGSYQGTYQLTEHIRIDRQRVNVTDEGYIIEVDSYDKIGPDDITFETDRLLFTIKDPEVEINDVRYNWIKDHITHIEDVLYSDYFNDPETGYKNYIDIESFADWYLINEIAKNPDACFYSSCYMNIAPDGKLKMGPLWDFDIAFGSNYFSFYDPSPKDFWVKNSKWLERMFQDPEFVELVKQRFEYFRSNKSLIISSLFSKTLYIQNSAIENELLWGTLKAGEDFENILYQYNKEVKYLENWIHQRFDWLENAIGSL
jgi:hypothetical protein